MMCNLSYMGGAMSELAIFRDIDEGNTSISNFFIDEYLCEANDAQIKVYLYLLRMTSASRATSISDMADKFNHTEKDIIRALKYWEKKHLLSLNYDVSGTIVGIRLFSATPVQKKTAPSASFVPVAVMQPIIDNNENRFEKPSYSLDDIKSFKSKDSTSELIFIAEQYLKKTLSPNDIRSLYFITDVLAFSPDLIDYLLQYCVGKEKSDFKYIEKVAINWAEEGITTVEQAKKASTKYDKNVYNIMNALGKSSSPTNKEVDFIRRWSNEFGFTTDIILEACERTVLATDKHRFEYADRILNSWKSAGVVMKRDIEAIDEEHSKKVRSLNQASKKQTSFHQYSNQSDVKLSDIEDILLRNSRGE